MIILFVSKQKKCVKQYRVLALKIGKMISINAIKTKISYFINCVCLRKHGFLVHDFAKLNSDKARCPLHYTTIDFCALMLSVAKSKAYQTYYLVVSNSIIHLKARRRFVTAIKLQFNWKQNSIIQEDSLL